MDSIVSFLTAIIGVIMIITFFIMASRLKKIENILDVLMQVELKKPVNQKHLKCLKCEKEFTVGVLKSSIVSCPSCKEIVK